MVYFVLTYILILVRAKKEVGGVFASLVYSRPAEAVRERCGLFWDWWLNEDQQGAGAVAEDDDDDDASADQLDRVGDDDSAATRSLTLSEEGAAVSSRPPVVDTMQ